MPAAIQETLQARLDRLAPDVREVASVASVVGRSFGQPLLERLVPPERLRPALSELQRLDLVVEERRRPTPEYRFRHGLVREAAYTSLLDRRRRDLHRVVGTALEELSANELSEAYGLLAHHFAEADEPERAARYLLEAGDAASDLYADEEALTHYRRALPFLDRLGDSRRAREVLFKVALAHHLAFDFEAANAAWTDAFAHPEPPVPRRSATQRLETAMVRPRAWVPGHGYDVVAWSFGPNFFRGLLRLARGLHPRPRPGRARLRVAGRPRLHVSAARRSALERRAPAHRGRFRVHVRRDARAGRQQRAPARRDRGARSSTH